MEARKINEAENISDIFRCTSCKKSIRAKDAESYQCVNCETKYQQSYGIIDTLTELSPATKNEILGMALENNYSQDNYLDFKIRHHDKLPGISEKLKSTENMHSHYYRQTLMNFEQVMDSIIIDPEDKVLEIGACYDYYFLKPFIECGCVTYALNLHFDLISGDSNHEGPIKIIADMNNLPFKECSFDKIIISATSHHSTTPECLINELFRVLKPGGLCLMINDPTWGLLKNFGGPDNTLAFRESHINENEYPIWKYNIWFNKSGFRAKHFFSIFWDDLLLNKEILEGTRFFYLAKFVQKIWQIKMMNKILKKYGLWFFQAVFGFPLNVVLKKPL